MKWKTKARLQRILSRIPGGPGLYYFGQRYFYGFQKFHIEQKLQQGIALITGLSSIGETVEGKSIVEIGTGWSPVLPLFFWLYGYEKCFTFDISRLLKESLVLESVKQLSNIISDRNWVHNKDINNAIKLDRRNLLQSLVNENPQIIMEKCNLIYCAPTSSSSTNLPGASIDLVYSNEVLEHIPEPEIYNLFSEMHRILRPGSYMIYQIDPSDHFSHSDPLISRINFLQFSQSEFSKYNSDFLFQNRLRISDYKTIIQQNGFSIVQEDKYVNKEAMQILPTLQFDVDFKKYPPEELCTTNYIVIAKRLP